MIANAVIILILAALIAAGVWRIYRTIRYGSSCCGTGGAMDKKIRVKDRNKSHYPYSYRVRVDGMVCAGCARRVENAFNAGGELWAKVDLEHKEVRVLAKKEMGREGFTELLKGTSYTLLEVS
ncbi:MAG: ATPase P [Lachnospiraceae bacterium]|nr:ATPase P [Lachnospiraceae bacterium]